MFLTLKQLLTGSGGWSIQRLFLKGNSGIFQSGHCFPMFLCLSHSWEQQFLVQYWGRGLQSAASKQATMQLMKAGAPCHFTSIKCACFCHKQAQIVIMSVVHSERTLQRNERFFGTFGLFHCFMSKSHYWRSLVLKSCRLFHMLKSAKYSAMTLKIFQIEVK